MIRKTNKMDDKISNQKNMKNGKKDTLGCSNIVKKFPKNFVLFGI